MTTCTTNRCHQGRTPCPTPGLCHRGTQPALPIQYAESEEVRDQLDEASKWMLAAFCLFALIAAIAGAAGYLTA